MAHPKPPTPSCSCVQFSFVISISCSVLIPVTQALRLRSNELKLERQVESYQAEISSDRYCHFFDLLQFSPNHYPKFSGPYACVKVVSLFLFPVLFTIFLCFSEIHRKKMSSFEKDYQDLHSTINALQEGRVLILL